MISSRIKILAASFTIGLATLFPSTNSYAFLGGVVGYMGFDVDIGLDSATRAFLQGYPEDIRKQVVLGANQVLDRADESVARVFVQSHGLLLGAKDVVVCSGRVMEHIPRGMMERFFGLRPDSYSAIAEQSLMDFRAGVKLIDSPNKIANGYTNIDNIASDAFCLTLQSDLDHYRVVRLRPEVKTSGLLWTRLEPLCENVRGCYALTLATVHTSMANAVRQDLVKTKAEERFAAIKQPPLPTSGWKSNFDLVQYEHALNSLLAINDDLIRVSTARAKAGMVKLTAFEGKETQVSQWLSAAEAERNGVTRCNRGYQLASAVKDVGTLRDQVGTYEFLQPAEWEAVKIKVINLSTRQKALATAKGPFINDGSRCWNYPIIPGRAGRIPY